MDEVEITGSKGDDMCVGAAALCWCGSQSLTFVGARVCSARNAPHARFDCLVHPIDKAAPDPRVAINFCPTCYCWVRASLRARVPRED